MPKSVTGWELDPPANRTKTCPRCGAEVEPKVTGRYKCSACGLEFS